MLKAYLGHEISEVFRTTEEPPRIHGTSPGKSHLVGIIVIVDRVQRSAGVQVEHHGSETVVVDSCIRIRKYEFKVSQVIPSS